MFFVLLVQVESLFLVCVVCTSNTELKKIKGYLIIVCKYMQKCFILMRYFFLPCF